MPDALDNGRRDHGPRGGIRHVIDILDRHGMRAGASLNSDVVERNPQIVAAGLERNWAWLAHGSTNSEVTAGMSAEQGSVRAIVQRLASTADT